MSRGAPGTGYGLYLQPEGIKTPVGNRTLYRASFASVEPVSTILIKAYLSGGPRGPQIQAHRGNGLSTSVRGCLDVYYL